jgi:hypothetical protein
MSYDAVDYNSSSGGHGVWFGEGSFKKNGAVIPDFHLIDGVLTEPDNGTATLTGSIVSKDSSGRTFDAHLMFDH